MAFGKKRYMQSCVADLIVRPIFFANVGDGSLYNVPQVVLPQQSGVHLSKVWREERETHTGSQSFRPPLPVTLSPVPACPPPVPRRPHGHRGGGPHVRVRRLRARECVRPPKDKKGRPKATQKKAAAPLDSQKGSLWMFVRFALVTRPWLPLATSVPPFFRIRDLTAVNRISPPPNNCAPAGPQELNDRSPSGRHLDRTFSESPGASRPI